MSALISRSQLVTRLMLMLLVFGIGAVSVVSQKPPVRSPSDTVREFYKAMREKRFREAFALSIYRPAIDPLKPQEFEDLRPDFEKMAVVLPDQVELGGEQISGELATVFVKVKEADKPIAFRKRICPPGWGTSARSKHGLG